MFFDLEIKEGITLGELREFVYNKLSKLPKDTKLYIGNKDNSESPIINIMGNENGIYFYKW